MIVTQEHNERVAKMTFTSVYPHYVAKIERKGRSKDELHQYHSDSNPSVELFKRRRNRSI